MAILLLPLVGFASGAEIITHGPRLKKQVALTFDADMTSGMLDDILSGRIATQYDKKITDYLISRQIPATFFITGLWAQTYPKETKALARVSYFEIGNHTFSHTAWTNNCFNLSPIANKIDEVLNTQKILTKLTGYEPKYFRFPGGCADQADIQFVSDLDLKIIGWDVASGDAFGNDPQKIIKKVLKQTKSGSIIVFHLSGGKNAPKTFEALPIIIRELSKRGYNFITISELLATNKPIATKSTLPKRPINYWVMNRSVIDQETNNSSRVIHTN
ncbi:MAG: polysaccharide deacetylase family protein [Patescibacteria group bacterium]